MFFFLAYHLAVMAEEFTHSRKSKLVVFGAGLTHPELPISLRGNGRDFRNIMIGVLSAIVDNIPVMFAMLRMNPVMPDGPWLLVTLTAGVGGGLLSIGSVAGVALMGQAKGQYTFFTHLKWIPAIAMGYGLWAMGYGLWAMGYGAGIMCHLWLNASHFYFLR